MMPKYVIIGSIRVVVEADNASEAEDMLREALEEIDCFADGDMEWEEITVGDAVEV